ncbi:MAG: hypothetical protein QOD32_1089 [Pyrinomonadaceae bacterium]|jgi:hypothetical protein|nr:hypothetical protein [Pyrinomonadaceae bacterium]
MEKLETQLAILQVQLPLLGDRFTDADMQKMIESKIRIEEAITSLRQDMFEKLREKIEHVEELLGENDDFSD